MRRRRPRLTRLLAWLATGPAGHLYATVADLVGLLAAEGRRRLSRSR